MCDRFVQNDPTLDGWIEASRGHDGNWGETVDGRKRFRGRLEGFEDGMLVFYLSDLPLDEGTHKRPVVSVVHPV